MKTIEELGVSPWPWTADDWSEAQHGEYDVRIRDAGDNEIAQPLSTQNDANMMAAAPKMYEALRGCYITMEWFANYPEDMEAVRIAKKHFEEVKAALASAAGEVAVE